MWLSILVAQNVKEKTTAYQEIGKFYAHKVKNIGGRWAKNLSINLDSKLF